jgi:hypothetical protein
MTDTEYAGKLAELDRLLNDPDVPMQPERIWALLADLSHRDLQHGAWISGSGLPAFAAAGD